MNIAVEQASANAVVNSMDMTSFEFAFPTRVVFEDDSINRLGEFATSLAGSHVLLVTDPGIVAAGHTARGAESLERAGLKVTLFDGARENPTTEHVQQGVDVAQECRPDLIVGLGGGSSMDCAKGINFIYTNGGKMQDYWGVGKANKPMLPMIAVPTTSGTGSELQSFALISDAQTHAKMACGDKKASCKIAVLDPRLTLTQPQSVTALTGVDALSHAIETYVTTKRNPISMAFSREAWRLIASSFRQVLQEPHDLEARRRMQLGSSFAGLAIENSMLGAAHALANPLTANYGHAHGQAVGVMLPYLIRFNARQMEQDYRELLQVAQGLPGIPDPTSGSQGLAEWVHETISLAGLKANLNDLGVPDGDLQMLSEQAAKQWTGTFNPVPVDANSLKSIYETSFETMP